MRDSRWDDSDNFGDRFNALMERFAVVYTVAAICWICFMSITILRSTLK